MRTPTDPTDKHVGTRVRMRRLMLGMSQTTLADALGLSFQQVQKYEKGKNRISASRLQQISNVLQVPVPFFFEGLQGLPGASKGKVQAPSPAYVTDFVASSDGLSLIKAFMLIKRRDLHPRHRPSHRRDRAARQPRRQAWHGPRQAASRPSTDYLPPLSAQRRIRAQHGRGACGSWKFIPNGNSSVSGRGASQSGSNQIKFHQGVEPV